MKNNAWIKNFLYGRHQAVVVDSCKSNTIPVRSGVSQGSVWGPCLFLVYINDLPLRVKSNTRLFADDTAIDRKIHSADDSNVLQADLDALAKWENEWDMSFHPDKCSVLHVSRSRTPLITDYFLHGQKLESVKSAKYLGVIIQTDGEFGKHITNNASSGSKTLGFIRRNLKINSKTLKETAYQTLARPKIEYASAVWDPYQKDQIEELEKLQRRAARITTNRFRNTSSVGEMLQDLGWKSLELRRCSL